MNNPNMISKAKFRYSILESDGTISNVCREVESKSTDIIESWIELVFQEVALIGVKGDRKLIRLTYSIMRRR